MPTEVTEYSIEMFWDCPNKHRGQLGRNLSCQICGYRKKETDEYYNPEDISIKNKVEEKLEVLAKAGPNWSCKYCGCSTRNTHGDCSICGADKPQSAKASIPPVKEESEEEPISSIPKKKKIAKYILAAGILAFLFFMFEFVKYLMRPHIGTLISSEIVCLQTHEELLEETQEGFDVPGQAYDIINLGSRFHHNVQREIGNHIEHYNERVVCGEDCHDIPVSCSTTPVSCTTTPRSCSNVCTSAKNGFANCRQTCTGGDRICSGGQRVCSGGGKSCNKRYCNEDRQRTVTDYGTFPVTQEYFSWKLKVWKNGRKTQKTLVACQESCQDWTEGDERLVSSSKEQTLVIAEDDIKNEYKTASCENLEVGATYSFVNTYKAKDFKKQ